MVRILILTSSSGAGHDRVAQALAQGLARQGHGLVQATVADPFQGPDLPSTMTRLYGAIIVKAPRLWGLLYRLTDSYRWAEALAASLEGAVAALLRRQRPHLIVSVHPLCHGAALRALRRMGTEVPVAVLVTDLMDIHAAWQAPGVSLFLAPTPEAAAQLVAWGCAPERVHPVGMPVHKDFRQGSGGQKALRLGLGLDPDKATVLLSGGGEGAGPLVRTARTVARALPGAQIVAACGRNGPLRRRFSALGLPGLVLGFVEDMAPWVRACDVVIGKAGAVTVAEAVAARRPLLITRALPGQEAGNLRFVLESDIGAHAPPGPPLFQALRDLEALAYRPSRWLENMARVDRPLAQDQAASLLIGRALAHA